ncbi:MAG: histidine kinase [Eubacteriales bacterium]|nr:histidine kinase [Eubacteriales bacterium]
MTKKINNLPLKHKLLAIMLIGLSIMAVMSFLIIQILSSSYNQMLYQSISESLSYSAKEITDYLDKMENLTQLFLSDTKVQQELQNLKKAYENQEGHLNALNKVSSYTGDYYYNYSDGILKYINLYTPASVIKTNLISADKVPESIQQEILAQSDEKDGAPCWVDTYMDEYGLFLARNIRQIEMLKLDTLGTILINIDMNALVKASTKFENQYGETAYLIRANGKTLYHTENLSDENTARFNPETIDKYSIEQVGDRMYFISHGMIEEYGWDYYCLVSYEEIDEKLTGIRSVCFWIIILDFLAVIFITVRLVGKLVFHISSLKDRMHQFALDNTQVPETAYNYAERKDELGLLNQQFDEMSRTIIALIQENYVNELLKKEAQLRALENQINPHFLYNTLDSIKWRAKSVGEKDITDMVESLSVLLRASLRTKDEKDYTVGREMEIVSSYITIQKLRYEERLLFENSIEESWYPYIIPKLVIQPLLENAIFYGVEQNVEECHIILSGEQKDGVLHFYVKNTGSEIEDDLLEKLETEEIKPQGHGVGLLNIHKRVRIQYGEAYGLKLYNEGDYAVAELLIPAEKNDVEINHC